MVRVLSIIPYKIFPARAGGQKNIALFNEYFSKNNDLVAVTVKSNDPINAHGYMLLNIFSATPARYINPLYLFTMIRLSRKYRATHLMLDHPYYGWLGILLKWFTGMKLIIHSQNIESERWKTLGKWWWKILWFYEQLTHRLADYNFFIQEDDLQYALQRFGVSERTCTTVTYGIDFDIAPSFDEKRRCKAVLQAQHAIASDRTVFLFNGSLDYQPNRDAVSTILEKINPLLLQMPLAYTIIICGKGLPASMNELISHADKNIVYAGFVDDITVYFKGADVFINPVIDGGGIKTKLVEALGFNARAVSTLNGAIGVTPEDTGGKLSIVANNNWTLFAQEMAASATQPEAMIPGRFFQKFYWGNIAKKAAAFIQAE